MQETVLHPAAFGWSCHSGNMTGLFFTVYQLEVYTFGCPRVGNASFSAGYDKLVPETWHVINDRDTVGCTALGQCLPVASMPCTVHGILS